MLRFLRSVPRVALRAALGLSVILVATTGCGTRDGCKNDSDCKGDRVCSSGRCVSPRSDDTEPSRVTAKPVSVVDELVKVEDGAGMAWKLPDGDYEITLSSETEIDFSLPGSTCPDALRIKSYHQACTVSGVASLSLRNPSMLGLGRAALVSVKVVRNP
jgi:hypothetical protein